MPDLNNVICIKSRFPAFSHFVAVLAIIVAVLTSCQQQIRHNKFDIAYAKIKSPAIENLTPADVIVVGPMDSSVVSLAIDEKTVLAGQIAQSLQSYGYVNAKSDSRTLSEAGFLFFNDFQNSYKHNQNLSSLLMADYKKRFPNGRWLVLSSLEGIKESNSKQTHLYKTLQSVSFKYKIWSLMDGRFAAEIGVEGYLYQSNERFIAESGNVAQRETANALYRLVNEDYPEKAPLEKLIKEATTSFVRFLKKPKGPLNKSG